MASSISLMVQQTAGQTNIYWIDGPGFPMTYKPPGGSTAYLVDSLTEAQSFTTTFCSTTTQNHCTPYNWYVYLVVDPGGTLDTTKSNAGNGTAP